MTILNADLKFEDLDMTATPTPVPKLDALGQAIAAAERPDVMLFAVVRHLADATRLPPDVIAATLHRAASEWEDMPPLNPTSKTHA